MSSEENNISKYTMESMLLYLYKIIKNLIVSLIISLVLLFGTIVVCLWYCSLPVEESAETVTQDLDGENNTMIGIDN